VVADAGNIALADGAAQQLSTIAGNLSLAPASGRTFASGILGAEHSSPGQASFGAMAPATWYRLIPAHRMPNSAVDLEVHACNSANNETSVFKLVAGSDLGGDYVAPKCFWAFTVAPTLPTAMPEYVFIKNATGGAGAETYSLWARSSAAVDVAIYSFNGWRSGAAVHSVGLTQSSPPASNPGTVDTLLDTGGFWSGAATLPTMTSQTASAGSFAGALTINSVPAGNNLTLTVSPVGVLTISSSGVSASAGTVGLGTPVWDDIIAVTALRFTGGTPVLKTFVVVDGQSVTQPAWEREDNNWVPFSIQTPHTFRPNSEINPHIHLAPASNMGANTAIFDLVWEIRAIGEAYTGGAVGANVFNGTATLGPNVNAKVHTMIHFGNRTPSIGATPSSIIVGAVRRRTGSTYSGDVFLVGFDFHIQKNKVEGDQGPYP
jgi:hypothetical protein